MTNMTFRASGTNHFILDDDGKITSVRIYVNVPLDDSVNSLVDDRLVVSDQFNQTVWNFI